MTIEILNKLNDVGPYAEICLYGEIGGPEFNLNTFRNELKELPKDIKELKLRIHSPGGAMVDGFAIFNSLVDFKQKRKLKLTAHVDGWSVSMASVIMMAADEIVAPQNTWVMIHNPISYVIGDSKELRESANLNDKYKKMALDAYMRHAMVDVGTISKMMDEETWLTASEAFDIGLVTFIGEEIKLAASIKNCKLKVPEAAMSIIEKESEVKNENQESDNHGNEGDVKVVSTESANESSNEETKAEEATGEEIDRIEVVPVSEEIEQEVEAREVAKEVENKVEVQNLLTKLEELNNKVQEFENVKSDYEGKISVLEDNLVKLSEEFERTEQDYKDRIAKLCPNLDVANDIISSVQPQSFAEAVKLFEKEGKSNEDAYVLARTKFKQLWRDSIKK